MSNLEIERILGYQNKEVISILSNLRLNVRFGQSFAVNAPVSVRRSE